MSEEQPQFKVTDRRLFNADGTPREVAEEEAASQTESATSASAESSENLSEAAPEAPRESARADASSASRAPSREASESRAEAAAPQAEEETADAHDPASFVNFLMSIASNAAASLGMIEHPVTGERGVDLELAKHWIDVLGMLEQKTRGNLNAQEDQILEGLLADLRMQYVSLTNASPSTKQRFSGRDIIGGR